MSRLKAKTVNKMIQPSLIPILLLISMLFIPLKSAYAHEMGAISVSISVAENDNHSIAVEFDAEDAMLIMDMDTNKDGLITWAEYLAHQDQLFSYIDQSIKLQAGEEDCLLKPIEDDSGVRFKNYPSIYSVFSVNCDLSHQNITINNSLLSEIAFSPLTLYKVTAANSVNTLISSNQINVISTTGQTGSAISYLKNGFYHVLIGLDHLAFLFLLLLPALHQKNAKKTLLTMTYVVTAFTLSHSITLSMVALDYISLPAKPVEVIIAFSILLTGLINLFKPHHQFSWMIAYLFGLVHGMGFASVLSELTGETGVRIMDLAAFNIGIELGQLLFVFIVALSIYLIIKSQKALLYTIKISSLLISMLGLVWILQRI